MATKKNRSGFMKHYRKAMKKGYSSQLGYKAESTIRRQKGKAWSIPARAKKKNPQWKPGKWIKAAAVRIRREAGRLVMDIKR